mmetsp:Transcript_29401/g.79014  ORF Transcript_29401/g.79014 Transcript_29401/m.79014 type:complete len:265 (-) Transcript_29401:61-855(-)
MSHAGICTVASWGHGHVCELGVVLRHGPPRRLLLAAAAADGNAAQAGKNAGALDRHGGRCCLGDNGQGHRPLGTLRRCRRWEGGSWGPPRGRRRRRIFGRVVLGALLQHEHDEYGRRGDAGAEGYRPEDCGGDLTCAEGGGIVPSGACASVSTLAIRITHSAGAPQARLLHHRRPRLCLELAVDLRGHFAILELGLHAHVVVVLAVDHRDSEENAYGRGLQGINDDPLRPHAQPSGDGGAQASTQALVCLPVLNCPRNGHLTLH